MDQSELAKVLANVITINNPHDVNDLPTAAESAFKYEHFSDRYDFLLKPSEEKRLFVLFSGANARGKVPLPIFQRWKWMNRFPGVVLNVADPGLWGADDLTLAWYVGDGVNDPVHPIVQTVMALAGRYDIAPSNIVFWGSSGGGFASLRAGACLPDSLSVAINPQTLITNYFESHVNKMLGANFNGISIRRFQKKFANLNSANKWIQNWNPAHQVIYAQNTQDVSHRNKHAALFCKRFDIPTEGGWSADITKQYILFDSDNGHGPEPEEFFPELLNKTLNFQSEKEQYQKSIATQFRKTEIFRQSNRIPLKDFLITPSQTHIGTSSQSPEERAEFFINNRSFRPRKDVKSYDLPRPVNWKLDPFSDTNWRMQLHALRCLVPLCIANDAKQDIKYIRAGMMIIMEWWQANRVRPQGDFAWYDMSVGLRSLYIAYFLQELSSADPGFDGQDLDTLRELVKKHADVLADESKFSLNNHGFSQAHGLKALTIVAPLIGLDISEYKDQPLQFFARLIEQQFGAEGMHMEHSPDYHFFAENLVKSFLASAWYDGSEAIEESLGKIGAARKWLRNPFGEIYTIGDSNPGRAQPDVSVADLGVQPLSVSGRQICAKLFKESGYGIIRTSPDMDLDHAGCLTLFAGHHDYAHKHADDLSIIWADNGQEILIDSGKYGYLRDKWRHYIMSTKAHNTIEIDDKSGPRAKDYAYGSALKSMEHGADAIEISAALDRPDFDVHHDRTVSWSPGNKLVIKDRLTDKKKSSKRKFVSWLHFHPSLELSRDGDAVIIKKGTSTIGHIICSPNMKIYRIAKGDEEDVLGWRSVSYAKIEPCYSAGFIIDDPSGAAEIKIHLVE